MTPPSATSPASEPRWLDDAEQEAWFGIGHLMIQLPGVLDAQLQRDSGLNLFEYFVLSRLSMAPDRSLRMGELSEVTGGSLSRLSNVVKRLEQRGYLSRRSDPDNRRFTIATLSESGWDKVVEAAPGHVAAVRRYVIDSLERAQLEALAGLGHQLLARLRGECDEDAG